MGLADRDDDVEEPAFRTPLPPDDRLWRHPSEIEPGDEATPDAPRARPRWLRLRKTP